MAVTVLWCTTGAPIGAVKGSCATLTQDALYIVPGRVAEPGSKLLVTPANIWQEGNIGNGFLSVSSNALIRQAELLEANPPGHAELDVVIFDDGLIIGPDQYNTVPEIIARKAAAAAISKATLEVLDRGGDLTSGLADFATPPGSPRPPATRWSDSMVRLILNSRNPRVTAEQLARIPDVSNLHRGQ